MDTDDLLVLMAVRRNTNKPRLQCPRLMLIVKYLLIGVLGLACHAAFATETVSLQLKWHHQFQFAGYYAAKELGYYREVGLDVDIVAADSETDPIRRVIDGKAQYGVGSNDLLMRRAAGKPVVVLGVIFQHSPYALMALQSGEIESVHDLLGKRVTLYPAATEIVAYLNNMGLPLESLQRVEPQGSDWRSLLEGRTDAYAGYITSDLYYLDKVGARYLVFSPRSEGMDFYGDNLFTTESEIAAHPDRVRNFLQASLKGWKYALAHPEETADLIISRGYFPASERDKLLYEARKIEQLVRPDLVDIGYMHKGRWNHIAQVYAEQGMMPKNVELDGFLYDQDADLLPGWSKWLMGMLLVGTLIASAVAWYVFRLNRTLFGRLFQHSDRFEKIVSRVPGVVHQLRRSPDGFYSFPFVSEAFERMFGVAPEIVREDASAVFRLLDPDDLDVLLAMLQTSSEQLVPLEKECRLVLENRRRVWIFWNALPERDTDGAVTWHGVISDMTERKRSEEEMRLASLIYQATSEAMMVMDPHNIILAVNPAFTEITGFTAAESVGKSIFELNAGKSEPFFLEALERELAISGKWQGETRQWRKSGEILSLWMSLNTIHDSRGHVQRRVALFSDITGKKQQEELIWRQANFDSLTGLPSRRMMYDHLEQAMRHAQRDGNPLAVLFIDLDRFKEINDTLGCVAGEELLRETARRLQVFVREHDILARLGCDQFVLTMDAGTDPGSAGQIAHQLLACLAQPYWLAGEKTYISASIGITLYPQEGQDAEALVRNANLAMLAAREQGPNQFCYFTPSMREAAKAHAQLAAEMHVALENQQFEVYYQPIIELATGRVKKAEALLRWQHPTLGTISAEQFISVAEKTRLILVLGDWVFKQSAMQVRRLRQSLNPEFQISVNKSPVQLSGSEDICSPWNGYLQEIGVPRESIVVEVAEDVLVQGPEGLHDQLAQLREQGLQVALDDFGKDCAPLSCLQSHAIDYVKIDRTFVRNLASGNHRVLCEAIIDMAHKLGLRVIAEGIETEEQLGMLKEAGCDFGQGYLLAHPLPPQEFERYCLARAA